MKTERETIKELLIKWGVIKDGVFSKKAFDKEVSVMWIRRKAIEYGLDKEGADKVAQEEPEDVCPKCGKNPCECKAEAPVVEAPAEEAPAVEEAPAEEASEEAEDAPKKKTAKKKA